MNKYKDIIHLNRPISHRKKMSMHDRAAQFAPFAALTGHNEAILETARLTDKKIELDENQIEQINQQILYLKQLELPLVTITFFIEDHKKEGGSYITKTERIKKIDEYNQTILLNDKTMISIYDIFSIESENK